MRRPSRIVPRTSTIILQHFILLLMVDFTGRPKEIVVRLHKKHNNFLTPSLQFDPKGDPKLGLIHEQKETPFRTKQQIVIMLRKVKFLTFKKSLLQITIIWGQSLRVDRRSNPNLYAVGATWKCDGIAQNCQEHGHRLQSVMVRETRLLRVSLPHLCPHAGQNVTRPSMD